MNWSFSRLNSFHTCKWMWFLSYMLNEEEKEKYIMLRNSIKEDLKENFISEEEYWQYNKEYSDKIKKNKRRYTII